MKAEKSIDTSPSIPLPNRRGEGGRQTTQCSEYFAKKDSTRRNSASTQHPSMKHIVFDIETIPQDEAKLLALAPEFTAPANLKDPAKIEAAIAKKRADYLADA